MRTKHLYRAAVIAGAFWFAGAVAVAQAGDADGGGVSLQPQPAPGGGEMVLLDGRLEFALQGRRDDAGALHADCVHLPHEDHGESTEPGESDE